MKTTLAVLTQKIAALKRAASLVFRSRSYSTLAFFQPREDAIKALLSSIMVAANGFIVVALT